MFLGYLNAITFVGWIGFTVRWLAVRFILFVSLDQCKCDLSKHTILVTKLLVPYIV